MIGLGRELRRYSVVLSDEVVVVVMLDDVLDVRLLVPRHHGEEP
jgi:hypothetical protein